MLNKVKDLIIPPVHAAITNPAIQGELGGDANDPTAATDGSLFSTYFVTIWQAIITIGFLMVLLFFVWAAIEWISAGGDSGKIEKARNKMIQAVIGLIILVASFAILSFISTLFFGDQFDILNLSFV